MYTVQKCTHTSSIAVLSAISCADNPLVFTETDGRLVVGFEEDAADPLVGVVERVTVVVGVEASGAELVGVELTVDMPWGVPRLLGSSEAEAGIEDAAEDGSITVPPGVSGTDDGSADECEVQPASSARATSAVDQRRA